MGCARCLFACVVAESLVQLPNEPQRKFNLTPRACVGASTDQHKRLTACLWQGPSAQGQQQQQIEVARLVASDNRPPVASLRCVRQVMCEGARTALCFCVGVVAAPLASRLVY